MTKAVMVWFLTMMAKLPLQKVISELLFLLSLYVKLFVTWWRFCLAIKMVADVEIILNEDKFFAQSNDTPEVGAEQHRKQECLKGVINKGEKLDGKKLWTLRVD